MTLTVPSMSSPFVGGNKTIEPPWFRLLQQLSEKVTALEARAEFVPMAAKVVSFTKTVGDPSGTQAITGVGFKPTALILLGATATPNTAVWGVAADGAAGGSSKSGGGTFEARSDFIYVKDSGLVTRAVVQSLDDDGFTLAWTNAGLPSGTLTAQVLCLK